MKNFAALLMVAVAAGGAGPAAHTSDRDIRDFQARMNEALKRMHVDMQVPFTGDADRDFARMMIPHHQGAVDMALVEIRYGKDARLRRLAQEIIVTQKQEITVMHMALGDPLPLGSPAPTQLPQDAQVHHEH